MAPSRRDGFRWPIEDDDASGALFAGPWPERHVGRGEYRGLEFLHVNARTIINTVPASSRMSFKYTINAYRGCSHACAYCMSGDTPILMADGRTKPLYELRAGDRVYGTVREGTYRRYTVTPVLAHWGTVRAAYRVILEDGTELVASGDHRFLSNRGWKYVMGAQQGAKRRPHLTLHNKLMGSGYFVPPPTHDPDYARGYICGIVRGDGNFARYDYPRPSRSNGDVYRFRVAPGDIEALDRAETMLRAHGVATSSFVFQLATERRRPLTAIRTQSRHAFQRITEILEWPVFPSPSWSKGFLAGIFDAEGSCRRGILRISNTDFEITHWIMRCSSLLGFDAVTEKPLGHAMSVRIRGGLAQRLRFFLMVDPAILRKRSIFGTALKSNARLGIVSIEPLSGREEMFDITTGTGDFIANGVVSHNCFARPTHEYLGLGIGEDFDRRIVVKVNAVERARAELSSPRWRGDLIAMGTNTDPYQHAEGKYHLTRGIVRALSERRNPFSILTKSTLVLRDLGLLAEAATRTSVRVNLSIGTLDRQVWRLTEPGTPPPDKRLEAVRRLSEAGIPCGVLVAPVLPGLSDADEQVTAVVEACRDAGVLGVSVVALHLRPGVREHYLGWLASVRPDLTKMYARRFSRGAYQPKQEQERLNALVRQVMGYPVAPGSVLMSAREAGVGVTSSPAPGQPAQLTLFTPVPDDLEKG